MLQKTRLGYWWRCSGIPLVCLLISCGGQSGAHGDRRGGSPAGSAERSDDAGIPPVDPAPSGTTKRRPPWAEPTKPEPEPPEMPFDDPGCPAVPQPVEDRECEPLEDEHGCPSGMGCFPFVDYPDNPCAPERFGTRCRFEGTGKQGDPCSGMACASGFLCVATGQGTQCARLCELPGAQDCPSGLICGSVDIQGFGVCF